MTSLYRRDGLQRRVGAIALGTLVLAASSYGFLIAVARALGPQRYASFAVVWALVFWIGPGVFAPLEQQTARAVASARAFGAPTRAVVLRALRRSAGLVGLLLVAVAASRDVLERTLGLDAGLLAGLAASLLGLSVAHPVRGVTAGLGRLSSYAWGLALEGLLRLGGGLALAVQGLRSAALFSVLAGVPAGVGAGLSLLRGEASGAPASLPALAVGGVDVVERRETVAGLVWLVTAGLCAQLLINLPPVAVAALAAPSQRTAAGQLLAGLLVARIPLLGVATAQTVLLPHLVRLRATGQAASVTRMLRRIAVACLALATTGAGLAALLGPAIMRLAFGSAFALTSWDLALLVMAVFAYLAATLLGLGLVAEHRGEALASSWVAGVVVAVMALVVVPGLVLRVEVALVAGCCTSAMLVAASTLRTPTSAHRKDTHE